tara:strand:+ start:865 stop:1224 length:360 start_codon:yes stop_codon:yes gene_type:complete
MAQYEELQIDQGTDVSINLELTDTAGVIKNLTGYTVKAGIKKTYNTKDSDATLFTSTITSPSTAGKVNLALTNIQTNTTNMPAGRYVYDVELSKLDSSNNNIIERILEGIVTVKPQVTP